MRLRDAFEDSASAAVARRAAATVRERVTDGRPWRMTRSVARRLDGSLTRLVAGSLLYGLATRPPPRQIAVVDATDSVALRVATRLASPLRRTVRRVPGWLAALSRTPVRTASLLVALLALVQLAQGAFLAGRAIETTPVWVGLLALSVPGVAVGVTWERFWETRVGRVLATSLLLPLE